MNIGTIKFLDYYLGIPLCFISGLILRIKEWLIPPDFNPPIEKMLLIKTWGLGNIVLMLPTLRAIRKKYPTAKVTFLSLKSNEEILKENPYIDSHYLLGLEGALNFFKHTISLIRQFRREKFDVVIDFDQFARFSALIALLTGTRIRIGFHTYRQGKAWVFNLPVLYNNNQHMALGFSNLVRKLGIEHINLHPVEVNVTYKDKQRVEAFLKENNISLQQILVGMHLGTGDNFPQRRWPIENFIEIAQRLIKEYGVKIILTGNNKEELKLNNYFCSRVKGNVLNVHSRFNIREVADLIKRCRVFLSADTAPLHIASAMGVPVVCFFGPNTPVLYGPRGNNDSIFYRGIPCSPCLTNFNAKTSKCKEARCITGITVEQVWESMKKYFQ